MGKGRGTGSQLKEPSTPGSFPLDGHVRQDHGLALNNGAELDGANPGTLLSPAGVGRYLASRGILPESYAGNPPKVTLLGGGVSNVVLLVEHGGERLVVKQPRERLLVAEQWLAKRERAVVEATALRLARQITPSKVPELLDLDRESYTITMRAAPADWRPWKELLLSGRTDSSIGWRLGEMLGTWHHSADYGQRDFVELDDLQVFEQLRIDPYHLTVAARHPELSDEVGKAVDELLSGGGCRCFVHGDFSPKNVLVGSGGHCVIDFEVAHIGNPLFDLAFLVTHLMLKSVRSPGNAEAYRKCALLFIDGYTSVEGAERVTLGEPLGLQVGCLLLARVHGKSPVEYLGPRQQAAVVHLGASLVRSPTDPFRMWPGLNAQ